MSGKNEFDVIVVGAGQNGLSTAAYLAKAGLNVVVLEDQKKIGGSVQTAEITAPGFKHDIAANHIAFAMNNPAIAADELELKSKYGLELINASDPSITTLYSDGTASHNYISIDKVCDEIAEWSQQDADAYRKFVDYLVPMLPLMGAGMFNAPPRMGALFNQLDQTPLGQEFMKLQFMTAWELAHQWFTHPKTILHMINFPTEAMINPEEGGSAFYLLALVPTLHYPTSVPTFGKGGVQNLTNALERAIVGKGGTILTDHEVVKITTKGGRATGVVCANGEAFTARKAVVTAVDPRLSLLKWLDTPLSAELQGKIRRISNPAFSGIMSHVALDEDPIFKWGGPEAATSELIEILPSSIEDYRNYFDQLRHGKIPKPIRIINLLHSRVDPSRAPEGKATLYHWQYVPYFLADGGPTKWDSIKEEVSNRSLEYFFSHTTNLSMKSILGREIYSPLDYARNNKNNVNGQILGPGAFLYQNMAFRPIPELGQYRTPVKGLYGAGQSYHPGGGITLGGRATAQIVMGDLGIDFDDVVS